MPIKSVESRETVKIKFIKYDIIDTVTEKLSQTPTQVILKNAVDEVSKAMHFNGDRNYSKVVNILVSLPDLIKNAPDFPNFPSDELEYLEYLAEEAKRKRDEDNEIGIITTLYRWGSKNGDPNNIERVYNRVFGKK